MFNLWISFYTHLHTHTHTHTRTGEESGRGTLARYRMSRAAQWDSIVMQNAFQPDPSQHTITPGCINRRLKKSDGNKGHCAAAKITGNGSLGGRGGEGEE